MRERGSCMRKRERIPMDIVMDILCRVCVVLGIIGFVLIIVEFVMFVMMIG